MVQLSSRAQSLDSTQSNVGPSLDPTQIRSCPTVASDAVWIIVSGSSRFGQNSTKLAVGTKAAIAVTAVEVGWMPSVV